MYLPLTLIIITIIPLILCVFDFVLFRFFVWYGWASVYSYCSTLFDLILIWFFVRTNLFCALCPASCPHGVFFSNRFDIIFVCLIQTIARLVSLSFGVRVSFHFLFSMRKIFHRVPFDRGWWRKCVSIGRWSQVNWMTSVWNSPLFIKSIWIVKCILLLSILLWLWRYPKFDTFHLFSISAFPICSVARWSNTLILRICI